MNKAELRRLLLKKRQSMTQENWRSKSDRICCHLQSSSLFIKPKTIFAYFSFRCEPDLSPLFTNSQHSWAFPRCVENSLVWHLWKPGNPIQTGSYGIVEPDLDTPVIPVSQADLILVPAVACDYQGYRLGYGGGYYDRLLSLSESVSKLTVGVTFEFAYLKQLPLDDWDKRLDNVCTEKGLKMIQN